MWTLAMMGHGRWDYARQAVESIERTIGFDFFDRTVLALDGDSGECTVGPFDEVHRLSERSGLSANLAQLWKAVGDDEWVFHCEEDFVIGDAPLDDMRDVLEANPRVANMVLLRQPWNREELAAGSVLNVRPQDYVEHTRWVEHTRGFWLNLSVYHASITEVGAGVEAQITERLEGRTFGYWGGATDGPRCVHIGSCGGMGSAGWRP